MAIIDKVSLNLSTKLGEKLNKSNEEIDVLYYGLFIFIHTLLGIILTIVTGLLTGMFIEIIVISITSSWFKRYTGGVHASSPERCLLIGLLLSLILSILTKYIVKVFDINTVMVISLLILAYCYYTLYRKCPVPSKNKPLKKENTRKKLRKKAFNLINMYTCLIIFLYIIYTILNINIFKTIMISSLLGILLQNIVLTNLGSKFIYLLDNIFNIF